MTKPITPDEVGAQQSAQLPDFVFQAVNELLARKCSGPGKRACLLQCHVVDHIVECARREGVEIRTSDVFGRDYLNFEAAYRAAGWTVEYDKPGYNESYEPRFMFTRAR